MSDCYYQSLINESVIENGLKVVGDTLIDGDLTVTGTINGGGAGGAATELATTGLPVNVDLSAPPAIGQVLSATSATTATWQNAGGGATVFNALLKEELAQLNKPPIYDPTTVNPGLQSVDLQFEGNNPPIIALPEYNERGYAGGDHSVISGGHLNAIKSEGNLYPPYRIDMDTTSNKYAAIGGGLRNNITGQSRYSVISGGESNRMDSDSLAGDNNNSHSAISGGLNNVLYTASYSSIGGGESNVCLYGTHNTIGGGRGNRTQGEGNTISGGGEPDGGENNITGDYGCIGGGAANQLDADYCVITGGIYNRVELSGYSTICGGDSNTCFGDTCHVTGFGNTIEETPVNSAIVCGFGNRIDGEDTNGSVIFGGENNLITSGLSYVFGSENDTNELPNVFMFGNNLLVADEPNCAYFDVNKFKITGSVGGPDGNLEVSGTTQIGGNLTVGGPVIIPETDDNCDLGSVTNRFKDIYISGNINGVSAYDPSVEYYVGTFEPTTVTDVGNVGSGYTIIDTVTGQPMILPVGVAVVQTNWFSTTFSNPAGDFGLKITATIDEPFDYITEPDGIGASTVSQAMTGFQNLIAGYVVSAARRYVTVENANTQSFGKGRITLKVMKPVV